MLSRFGNFCVHDDDDNNDNNNNNMTEYFTPMHMDMDMDMCTISHIYQEYSRPYSQSTPQYTIVTIGVHKMYGRVHPKYYHVTDLLELTSIHQ